MRVYQFQTADIALKILREQQLKISLFNKLNDPFELIGYATGTDHDREALIKSKDQLATKFGVVCFSKTWKNPVQWSHYADKHKGLCLGFDVLNPEIMTPVKYTSDRPIFSHDGINLPSETLVLDMLSTKFSHWKYEKEVRFFTPLNDKQCRDGAYYLDFEGNLTLKEVIIGPNSKVTSDQIRKSICCGLQPKIVTTRLAHRTFNVARENQKLT